MGSGYVLVLMVLVLGGVIATVGDRLGSKVGKARLRLFNLRPRQTAVLITILTGSFVSASTLTILLLADARLRTGIFRLEQIQTNLRTAREQLEETRLRKEDIEAALVLAQAEQDVARRRLDETNRSLSTAIAQQRRTAEQLSKISDKFSQAQDQLQTVNTQAVSLRSDIQRLQNERKTLLAQQQQVQAQITQRDQQIAARNQLLQERDREIAQRDQVLAQRAQALETLELRRLELENILTRLAREYQAIRQGRVQLASGAVLAAAVVQLPSPAGGKQVIDQILNQANQAAIQLTQPGVRTSRDQVIRISEAEVEQTIAQIQDGNPYLVLVLSAANYVLGERDVRVVLNVIPNRLVFRSGEVIAAAALVTPGTLSQTELEQRMESLIAAAEFRAAQQGVIFAQAQIAGQPPVDQISNFIAQLREINQNLEIQILAAQPIYASGPLEVKLVAQRNGVILFESAVDRDRQSGS